MNAVLPMASDRVTTPGPAPTLDEAIATACRAMAPAWPLDQQIAVNPWWGYIDRPFTEACSELRRVAGLHTTLPPGDMLRAWRERDIEPRDLERALREHGLPLAPADAIAALERADPTPPTPDGPAPQGGATSWRGLPLPSDLLEPWPPGASGPLWSDTITQQLSQYCASWFDEDQADWHRDRSLGFFGSWRHGLEDDHAIEPLMHVAGVRAGARALPSQAGAAIAWSLARLGVGADDAPDFLAACLWRINGWAGWCAWLAWQARLAGRDDDALRELLAMRVSWEALLVEGAADPARHAHCDALRSRWRAQWLAARRTLPGPQAAIEAAWQRAHEIAYQRRLVGLLYAGVAHDASRVHAAAPPAQLVFCIDVRSERFRRALEQLDPALETRGYAGFFGLPIEYTPLGSRATRPQLPGLLAPALGATDSTGNAATDARIARERGQRLDARAAAMPFQRLPTAGFSLVEAIGLGYAARLLQRHWGRRPATGSASAAGDAHAHRVVPRLCVAGHDSVARKAELAEGVLRSMGLPTVGARLLVLVGHGSSSSNNPQAAALACGACGGHSGEVNARALAQLLNDGDVRSILARRGMALPASTWVVAALHDTTTDEVRLHDVAQAPATHAADLERLRLQLAAAGERTRAERAPTLGLADLAGQPRRLLARLQRRARDWAETRPEWGLAGNAAMVIAPRSRTRGLDLDGRAFLHDYAPEADADGRLLEQLMGAPMVVAHWINLQYYASTVEPARCGSGNKVLHNVACGRIGVFEGNTGDLRTGLPRQSLHDGERWRHAPLRLSVFIEAPRPRIDAVLARNPLVRQLVDHGWLHLFRFGGHATEWRQAGRWRPWDLDALPGD